MPKLKLAASNIGWAADDDDYIFSRMAKLNFAGIEIAPTRIYDYDPYSHAEDFGQWAQRIQREYGLCVCSMQSIWRGQQENLFDRAGAEVLLGKTKAACDFAQAGDVHNLVFGCPSNRNIPEGKEAADAKSFLNACGKLAAAANTIFALEPNPPIYNTNFLNTTDEAVSLLESMDEKQGLGLNLDIGSMIYNGENMVSVERALPYINHVHISEPGLLPPEHRAIHRELRTLLENYGYDGYVSLEMKCADTAIVDRELEYLAETFTG